MKIFKNIIFDLDGTLVDSSLDIINSLHKAYLQEFISNIEITRFHIGPKLNELISILTPQIKDATKQRVIKNYRNIYDNLEDKKAKLYTGVYDSLKELKNQGFSLFIATNKPDTATVPLLKYFKIDTFFNGVFTPSSIKGKDLNKKQMILHIIETYQLDKQQCIMVGDHQDDIIAAKDNGISSAAILYGYSEINSMKRFYPDFEINFFPDVLTLVGRK